MEKQRLKTEADQAQGRIEELARQVREVQDALGRTVLEKDTHIEALKLEKSQLEGELIQAERGLQEQVRQYQQTIEELTAARSMDASALQVHCCFTTVLLSSCIYIHMFLFFIFSLL